MAYYSGQAVSYQELLDVLVSACVMQGWTWADGILNKGNIFVKLSVAIGDGAGIVASSGTGKVGANLTNASPIEPRLGRNTVKAPIVTFPLNYMLHVFNDINEVFLIIKFDNDRYHYLAFGTTATSGLCLWVVATAGKLYTSSTSASFGFAISATVGLEQMLNYSQSQSCGPFWCTRGGVNNDLAKTAIYTSIDNNWVVSTNINDAVNAIFSVSSLINKNPSNWNNESILIPIEIQQYRASNKKSIVANIECARYLRIDNYEPEQIIVLGHTKWKVYPFYRKNIQQRDGGGTGGADHTGTFGWAIRYDGP